METINLNIKNMVHQNQAIHCFSIKLGGQSLNHDGIKQKKKKRNKKKRKHFIGKRKVKLGFEISHPKVNLQNQHMTTRPS